MALMLAVGGCFRSASLGDAVDSGPADAGPADAGRLPDDLGRELGVDPIDQGAPDLAEDAGGTMCEGVCFEWLEDDATSPLCNRYVSDPSNEAGIYRGCPEGYECVRAHGGGLDEDGLCRATAADAASRLRFDTPATVPLDLFDAPGDASPDAVPVTLALGVDGGAWPGADRPYAQATIRIFRWGEARELLSRRVFPGDGPVSIDLVPGEYDLRYEASLELVTWHSADIPTRRRAGRLVVEAAGEARVDLPGSRVVWTLSVDGEPTEAQLLLFHPELPLPLVSGGQGSGQAVVEPGSYEVLAAVGERPGPEWVRLGPLEVTGDRTFDVALERQPVRGTVRRDGRPVDRESVVVWFRPVLDGLDPQAVYFVENVEFPVDAATGVYEGSVLRGLYTQGVYERAPTDGDDRIAYRASASTLPAPVMDVDMRPGRVTYSLRFAGELPATVFASRGWGPLVFDLVGATLDEAGEAEAVVTGELPAWFAVRLAPAGRGWFARFPVGRVDVAPGAERVEVDVPVSTLRVSLTNGGVPWAPASRRGPLTLWSKDADAWDSFALPEEGALTVEGTVASGRYDLWFRLGEGLGPGPMASLRLEELTLEPGRVYDLSYELPVVTLTGVVTIDGHPPGSARGRLYVARNDRGPERTTQHIGAVPVAGDGSFELSLVAGIYDLAFGCWELEGCDPETLGTTWVPLVHGLEVGRE